MTAPLVAGYRAVVCDLDGVVYRGRRPVAHAVEALGGLEVLLVFATNNASRTPEEVAEHLGALGLACAAEDVATSAQAAAWILAHELDPGAHVLAVGGPGVGAALRESGLDPVAPSERPHLAVDAVVQGYGPGVSAADLAEAAYAIEGGARWVATNTDATLPTDRGIAPGNGTLIAAVARAVGHDPHTVAGKPEAPLYELCASRLGVPTSGVLAVGDRLETDVAGAVAAGMDSLLVLTGVDDLGAVLDAPVGMRPTHVAPDLRALHRSVTDGDDGPSVTDLDDAVARVHAATDRGAPAAEVDTLRRAAHDVLARTRHG